MSTISVYPNGSGSPIQAAVNAAKAGDIVELNDGTYKISAAQKAIWHRSKVTIKGKNFGMAVIDATDADYCIAGVDLTDIAVEGVWLKGGGATVSFTRCVGVNVSGNIVSDSYTNAISIQQGDYHTVEDNILFDNVQRGARSAISFLMHVASTAASRGAGPRIVCRGNVGWGNTATEGPGTDAFIILDGKAPGDTDFTDYQYDALVEKNIACGNGGSGIRTNWWKSATVRKNVAWDNLRDTRKDGTWRAELHNQWSKNIKWEDNLGIAFGTANRAFRNDAKASGSYIPDPSGLNLTFSGNKLYNKTTGAVVGGDPDGVQLPPATTGTIHATPAVPGRPATAAAALASRDALRAAFADILGGTSVTPFSIVSPPAITSTVHESGKPLTFDQGVYAPDNLTVVTKAQLMDAGGIYRALEGGASINPMLYPELTIAGDEQDFRVINRVTKPDGTEVVVASASVKVKRPVVVPVLTLEERVVVLEAAKASQGAQIADLTAKLADQAERMEGIEERLSNEEDFTETVKGL